MDSPFTLTFWGVRGGYPVPGSSTLKYGGNTTCFEIRAGKHTIIIDGGTGVIGLGRRLVAEQAASGGERTITVFVTHLHHDHTQGLPFFVAAREPSFTVHMVGPVQPGESMPNILDKVMVSPVFPVTPETLPSSRTCNPVRPGDVVLIPCPEPERPIIQATEPVPADIGPETVVVRVGKGKNHPTEGVLFYRVEYQGRSVVIATDTEGTPGGDPILKRFARGCTVLVHDAEYDTHEYINGPVSHRGWGHSTWNMAVEMARLTQAQSLVLTHHSPMHDDAYLEGMLAKAQQVFPRTVLAREGMTIEIE